jgi:hypothetical protein
LTLGFPFAFCSLQKPGDIRLMSIEDQGGNNNTDDEVRLGIASEKGNQNWNGCCANEGPKRDKPPFPHDPRKDQKLNQDCNG